MGFSTKAVLVVGGAAAGAAGMFAWVCWALADPDRGKNCV